MELRVWVGCLAHYNAGALIGDWVPAESATEWRCPVSGTRGVFGECEETWCMEDEIPWESGELSPHEATLIAQWVEDVEDSEVPAFVAYMKEVNCESMSDETVERFRNAYRGEFDSPRDFAMEWFEEIYGEMAEEMIGLHSVVMQRRIPEVFLSHFDWESYTEELFSSGYTFTGGFVFEDCE